MKSHLMVGALALLGLGACASGHPGWMQEAQTHGFDCSPGKLDELSRRINTRENLATGGLGVALVGLAVIASNPMLAIPVTAGQVGVLGAMGYVLDQRDLREERGALAAACLPRQGEVP